MTASSFSRLTERSNPSVGNLRGAGIVAHNPETNSRHRIFADRQPTGTGDPGNPNIAAGIQVREGDANLAGCQYSVVSAGDSEAVTVQSDAVALDGIGVGVFLEILGGPSLKPAHNLASPV